MLAGFKAEVSSLAAMLAAAHQWVVMEVEKRVPTRALRALASESFRVHYVMLCYVMPTLTNDTQMIRK
jgi:hypothetical protein